MKAEFQGVSFHTGMIKIIRKDVSPHSDNASACRIVVSMSSGSYSGLAMHELVQRKPKALDNAPKIASSGNAEQ
jgi:hypothetical protein